MALLQESKVLYEQDTQIKAIFSGGARVWPAARPSFSYYLQCSSDGGYTVLVPNINTNNISISYKALQANTIGECMIGILEPDNDDDDLRLVIAGEKTSTDLWRRFDHGNLQEENVIDTFDFETTYIVNLEYSHLYMFNCDTNQVFVDSSFNTPTNNILGDLKLYNVQNSKVYWIKLVVEGTTLLDAEVDAWGLYDKVSQQYITPAGWTVQAVKK